MSRTFAAVRPYPTGSRRRIFELLESMGYRLGEGHIVPERTPDADAARWIVSHRMDVLVLPFHLHRDAEGVALDGVGVLLKIPEGFVSRIAPVIMPVSRYSWESSYALRRRLLNQERPSLADRVFAVRVDTLDDPQIVRRIERHIGNHARGSGTWAADDSAAKLTESVRRIRVQSARTSNWSIEPPAPTDRSPHFRPAAAPPSSRSPASSGRFEQTRKHTRAARQLLADALSELGLSRSDAANENASGTDARGSTVSTSPSAPPASVGKASSRSSHVPSSGERLRPNAAQQAPSSEMAPSTVQARERREATGLVAPARASFRRARAIGESAARTIEGFRTERAGGRR